MNTDYVLALRLHGFCRRVAKRPAAFVLAAFVAGGCSSRYPGAGSGLPPQAERALRKLVVGITESQALEIMEPVSSDWGRLTYGGTGAGELVFQVSATQQIRVELEPETRERKKTIGVESQIDLGPRFVVQSIGPLEPKGKWMLDANHNFTD